MADSGSADDFYLSVPGPCPACVLGIPASVPGSCSDGVLGIAASVPESCSASALGAAVCVLAATSDTCSEHLEVAAALLVGDF